MTVFSVKGDDLNIYEVYLVSDFRTDKYTFEAESEYAIKYYLVNDCNIFSSWIKTKSIDEIFDHLRNNKRTYSFTFACGRYYYLKEIKFIKKKNKNIQKNKNSSNHFLFMNRCVIS